MTKSRPAHSRRQHDRTVLGGWAASTSAHPDHELIAVGLGAEPDGVWLTKVTDPRPYGFSLDQPLSVPLQNRIARHPEGQAASKLPRARDWHRDQIAVMWPEI